jgi:hypothetical protein
LTFCPVPFSSPSNICILKSSTFIVLTITVSWCRD